MCYSKKMGMDKSMMWDKKCGSMKKHYMYEKDDDKDE